MNQSLLKLIGIIIFIISTFCFCSTSRNIHYIIVAAQHDSCYSVIDSGKQHVSAFRDIEIIENTFVDTVSLGFNIVMPKTIR